MKVKLLKIWLRILPAIFDSLAKFFILSGKVAGCRFCAYITRPNSLRSAFYAIAERVSLLFVVFACPFVPKFISLYSLVWHRPLGNCCYLVFACWYFGVKGAGPA